MLNTNKKIIWLLGGFLLIEALSFLSFVYPLISPFVFGLLFLASLAVSIYSLEYGLLIILAELLIGSMGHLFYFSVGAYQLPIRIAIWSGLMAVFVIKFVGQLIKNKNTSEYWQRIRNFPLLKYFLILFALIIVGLANGFLRHHGLATIFNDFNAWLYFLLLFPLIAVYGHVDEGKLNRLRLVFLSGALWLSLETLFLLFVFTHNLSFTTEIYNWLRRTIVGEVTPTLSGWPRIFIQSQIYPAIAFFIIFWWRQTKAFTQKFFSSKNIGLMFMAGLFISSVLISFSRSFWVGLIVALVFALIIIVRLSGFRKIFKPFLWLGVSGIIGFILIYIVAIFPFPAPGAFSADFLSRLRSENDAAVASRWSLLPVLVKAIIKEPFLGQGYGATVTYYSRDPRILQQNPSGLYTTYAFEWNYLDLWLKIGIIGLLAYILLLFKILALAWPKKGLALDYLKLGLSTGLVFLAATNLFTPYLNHPLGIGFLLLASCLISADRVY